MFFIHSFARKLYFRSGDEDDNTIEEVIDILKMIHNPKVISTLRLKDQVSANEDDIIYNYRTNSLFIETFVSVVDTYRNTAGVQTMINGPLNDEVKYLTKDIVPPEKIKKAIGKLNIKLEGRHIGFFKKNHKMICVNEVSAYENG